MGQRLAIRGAAWGAALGAVLAAGAAPRVTAAEAAPAADTSAARSLEPPRRVEPGLADRRQRWARTRPEQIAMLPARFLRLPVQIVGYPLEHWVVHREPGAVTVYTRRALTRLGSTGVRVRLSGVGSGSGYGGGLVVEMPRRLTLGAPLRLAAATTHRGYDLLSASLDSLAWGPSASTLRVSYAERPQEDFFGLGPRSREDDRATYQLNELRGDVETGLGLGGAWVLVLAAGVSRNDVGRGRDPDFPTVREVFDAQRYAGLDGRFQFADWGARLVRDRRDVPSYARRGTYLALGVQAADGIGGTRQAYTKLGLEAQQFVPLPGNRRSLAARLLAVVTDVRGTGDLPVFRLERVGNSRSVRGYRTYRFTEHDALVANFEYRFPIWTIAPPSDQALDGAVFFDFGTAVPDLERLQQRDLRSAAGLGFRFVNRRGMLLRLDTAWTGEGSRIHAGLRGTF